MRASAPSAWAAEIDRRRQARVALACSLLAAALATPLWVSLITDPSVPAWMWLLGIPAWLIGSIGLVLAFLAARPSAHAPRRAQVTALIAGGVAVAGALVTGYAFLTWLLR